MDNVQEHLIRNLRSDQNGQGEGKYKLRLKLSDDGWREIRQLQAAAGFPMNVASQTEAAIGHSQGDPFGESLIVMEFDETASPEAVQWIMDKIQGPRKDGGLELRVRKESLNSDSQAIVFHISATHMKLLDIADEMGFMKRTKAGIIRKFDVACLDQFFYTTGMTLGDILTPADRQIIIKYALESIRAANHEPKIPGTEIILNYGQSIIHAAQSSQLIVSLYSLHDKPQLEKLRFSWTKPTTLPPIDKIRDYFGESIGMYFSFLGFYTIALMVSAVLGFLQLCLPERAAPLFCICYVIWMAVFLQLWKRKSSSHAYLWGTITMTNLDEPRAGYYGKLKSDPITGNFMMHYPKWKTYRDMCLVSLPTIIFCLVVASIMIIFQYYAKTYLEEHFGSDSYIVYLPSVVKAIYIYVSTLGYHRLATKLTDRENHRTQKQYELHRIFRLIVLEFVNNFLSLFYIAYVLQDMEMLKKELMMQLMLVHLLQNGYRNLYPYFRKKVWPKIVRLLFTSEQDKLKEAHDFCTEMGLRSLKEDDPRMLQTRKEFPLVEYNNYDDYLTLYIQFGYVTLFPFVTPLSAFLAIVNNVIKIRMDAYRLCTIFKRPFANRAKNIGAWQHAFETLVILSILTNSGILYLSPQITAGFVRETYVLTFFIIARVLAWVINKAIPDRPYWVRVALAKAEHDSRQALKREMRLH